MCSMNRRELITMVAGGTITPLAVKAYTSEITESEITESEIKEVFKRNGFHVTTTNFTGVAGLFCVEWGDIVTDFSMDGKYMKYVISRDFGGIEEKEYVDFALKECRTLVFSNLMCLNHHIDENLKEYDFMSFGNLYHLENGEYMLRYIAGSSDQFYNGAAQGWANPKKYKNSDEV